LSIALILCYETTVYQTDSSQISTHTHMHNCYLFTDSTPRHHKPVTTLTAGDIALNTNPPSSSLLSCEKTIEKIQKLWAVCGDRHSGSWTFFERPMLHRCTATHTHKCHSNYKPI